MSKQLCAEGTEVFLTHEQQENTSCLDLRREKRQGGRLGVGFRSSAELSSGGVLVGGAVAVGDRGGAGESRR